jgi:hypothetical protein
VDVVADERRGLSPAPERTPSGHRRYDEETVPVAWDARLDRGRGQRPALPGVDRPLEAVGTLSMRSNRKGWARQSTKSRPHR